MRRTATVFAGLVSIAGVALFAGCGGGGGGGGDGPRRVLVVAASGYIADVVSKLDASGEFASVDLFDAATGTPSLAALRACDAVLVVKDDTFDNAEALGDVLADFVDEGGGVVVCHFCFELGVPLQGRFDTDDYWAIVPGNDTSGGGPQTLDIDLPGDPLVLGVLTFSGGTSSYRPTNDVHAGATRVASWTDGSPLIARRSILGTRRVDLGFYPPSSDIRVDFWDASTDGVRIMTNALRWVSHDL